MKRNKYDDNFKYEAIKLALSGELTYAQIARGLGVNYQTLCYWIRQMMNQPKTSTNNNFPNKKDYQHLNR